MKRIFIVEDEAIIAIDLAEQLEELGYQVIGMAHDGESAIEKLAELSPELILMDIVLGHGIDGIETAEQILKTRSIPIIFLTAFSDKTTVARASKIAPYGYVTKPYNAQALSACIEIALTKHQLDHKLFYKERWFSNILHAVNDGIIAVGIDGLVHFVNLEACRLIGVQSADELTGKDLSELIQIYDSSGTLQQTSPVASAMQRNAVMSISFNGSVKNISSGRRIYVDYSAAPVRGKSNTVVGGILALRDASSRIKIESEIRKSDSRFQSAFENSTVGVGLIGLSGKLIEYNDAFTSLLDLPNNDDITIIEAIELSYSDRNRILEGQLELLSGQRALFQHEVKLYPSTPPEDRWLMINISLLHDQETNPSYYFYQIYDHTDRKQAEQKLVRLSDQDEAFAPTPTSELKEKVHHLLEQSEFESSKLGVICIDIDDLPLTIAPFEPASRDILISEITARLQDIPPPDKPLMHLEDGRFVIIMPSIQNASQAVRIANRALEEISEPLFLGSKKEIDGSNEINMTAHAGVAIAPEDGTSADILLQSAEDALKLAQASINERVYCYSEGTTSNISGLANEAERIAQALSEGQLSCRLIPLRATKDDVTKPVVKAQVYWKERNCFITSDSFFDLANNKDASSDVLIAVVQQVCEQLNHHYASADQPIVIIPFFPAILVSSELVKRVAKQVQSFGLRPEGFAFGLTGRRLRDSKAVANKIHELKQEGFQLFLNLFNGQNASVDLLYNFSPELCELAVSHEAPQDIQYLNASLAMAKALNIPIILNSESDSDIPLSLREGACYLLSSKSQGEDIGILQSHYDSEE